MSHCHGPEVEQLVLQVLNDPLVAKLLLTLNSPEALSLPKNEKLVIIENQYPKGFGSNHNAAFKHCLTPYFCVLNPDIVLMADSFSKLLSDLIRAKAGVAGPLVISATGRKEDSWRKFPTILSLFMKALGNDTTIMKQPNGSTVFSPDWIAGMFMLFEANSYSAINGFDERLFLYYEDVDICARLWGSGKSIVASSDATVIHKAQRASHRELRHMCWHLSSMIKYLVRYSFNMPKCDRAPIQSG